MHPIIVYHKLEQFYLSGWLDQVNKKVISIAICESEVILPPEISTILLAIATSVLVFIEVYRTYRCSPNHQTLMPKKGSRQKLSKNSKPKRGEVRTEGWYYIL
ncbi:hypothetical protein [Nostoc sp.]|uniref:hypothetical protein n=1 Tax=Nostoc sp. TaxID=1180 RepID=UPI002FF48D23